MLSLAACVKTEVRGIDRRRFVVTCNFAARYKFLAPLFTMISWIQVKIQGVEHNLQRIEQIGSRLYNNEDTQSVIQELRKQEHERTITTLQTLFLQLGGTGKRCRGQNLIPDIIFVSVRKFQGKLNLTPWKHLVMVTASVALLRYTCWKRRSP